jgi:hypothetical protein
VREKEATVWKRLNNEELYKLYASSNISKDLIKEDKVGRT